jgi:chemotaxis protein histidine kinase CheA
MSLERWHIPACDEEFVDVFLEEVEELLHNIDSHMKTWMNYPGDKKALTELRRSFHTLKGSGRMVKALDLSEIAWKVEKMLNQAIAGTIPVSEPMVRLVTRVRAQLPSAVDAFKNRRSISGNPDIERLMKLADALAAWQMPALAQAPVLRVATATGGDEHFKLHEINAKLDRCMQRADEALHRSELALQQARAVSALHETPPRPVAQRDYGADVERIGEIVNRLSKEMSGLRLDVKKSQREFVLRQSEMSRLVGQRVRVAPSMIHLRSEIERNVAADRRAVKPLQARWLSVILSILVGGLIAAALVMLILSIA